MLGENIKTYRQKKGYTQEEVANRLHVTRQTISKWEKNYSVPDAEVFVKLADVLEVQTSQLLEVKVDSDVQTTEEKQNAYAEQLAHIAEQMAITLSRSQRSARLAHHRRSGGSIAGTLPQMLSAAF